MSKRIIAGALAGAVLASTMAPMGVYADSPEVNIWVSKVNATDSGMEKGLEKQTPVHFGSGDSASTNNLIVVDENNTYQTVDGFGASITEASAHLYQTNLDDSAKAAAMQALFDKECVIRHLLRLGGYGPAGGGRGLHSAGKRAGADGSEHRKHPSRL